MDDKIMQILRARVSKLQRWAQEKNPALPLVVIAESAGTHLAQGLLRVLEELQWEVHRVVLAGFCFPPLFMRELMIKADHRYAIVVHEKDGLCLM